MTYYFGIKETSKHDFELAVIEADTLEQAKKEFADIHPDDVNNIEYINEKGSIYNLL